MWSPFFSAFSCNSHLTLSGFPCAKSVVAFKSSKPSHCTSWCTFSYGCYIPKYNTKYHEAAGCKMWHLCRAGASCNVELPPLATVSNFGVPTPTTTRMNSIILTSVYNCSQMSEGEQHGGTNSAFCTHGSPIDRAPQRKVPRSFLLRGSIFDGMNLVSRAMSCSDPWCGCSSIPWIAYGCEWMGFGWMCSVYTKMCLWMDA